MAEVDLDDERFEKHREAGAILVTVMGEARELVEPGASLLEVAETAEARIEELGGEPAFPVNISLDEEASHATPARDDERTFGESVVCLDLGVHVDGWIADAAVTVDLAGEPGLAAAAEDALEAAIATVEPGVHTGQVGAAIERAIDDAGYNPIVNLSGHGLDQYDAHTGPNIPNRAVDSGIELEAGQVLAIEPFASTGSGKVGEGASAEIYSLLEARPVRDRRARKLLETIDETYQTLPFAARWLDEPRADLSLTRLERAGAVRSYPVLKEVEGALVSQAEHTVIVTDDGCEVVTAGLFE